MHTHSYIYMHAHIHTYIYTYIHVVRTKKMNTLPMRYTITSNPSRMGIHFSLEELWSTGDSKRKFIEVVLPKWSYEYGKGTRGLFQRNFPETNVGVQFLNTGNEHSDFPIKKCLGVRAYIPSLSVVVMGIRGLSMFR